MIEATTKSQVAAILAPAIHTVPAIHPLVIHTPILSARTKLSKTILQRALSNSVTSLLLQAAKVENHPFIWLWRLRSTTPSFRPKPIPATDKIPQLNSIALFHFIQIHASYHGSRCKMRLRGPSIVPNCFTRNILVRLRKNKHLARKPARKFTGECCRASSKGFGGSCRATWRARGRRVFSFRAA